MQLSNLSKTISIDKIYNFKKINILHQSHLIRRLQIKKLCLFMIKIQMPKKSTY